MVQALTFARQTGQQSVPKVTTLALPAWVSASNQLLCQGGYVEDITEEQLHGYWVYDPVSFEDPGFSYEQSDRLVSWDLPSP